MKKFTVRDLATQVMIAAMYVVLVLIFWFASYGEVQFRVAEVLLVLVFFRKKHAIGLLIGTFIAGLFSPFGFLDACIGTLASAIAILGMILLKKVWCVGLIMPAIANGFIIAILIVVAETSFSFNIFTTQAYWVAFSWVALGELLVMYLLGVPLYLFIQKNKDIKTLIEN